MSNNSDDPCNLIQYFRDGEHCGDEPCRVREQGCPCTMAANRLEQLEADLLMTKAYWEHEASAAFTAGYDLLSNHGMKTEDEITTEYDAWRMERIQNYS